MVNTAIRHDRNTPIPQRKHTDTTKCTEKRREESASRTAALETEHIQAIRSAGKMPRAGRPSPETLECVDLAAKDTKSSFESGERQNELKRDYLYEYGVP